jgi:hypothetical protein
METTPKRFDEERNGFRYLVKEKKEKGKVVKRIIETPVCSAFLCSLSIEKSSDRFWISLGFGEELQTGDSGFDKRIYVIGDHPLVGEYLIREAKLRSLFVKLIGYKVTSIAITGKTVRFALPESTGIENILPAVQEVAESIQRIQPSVKSRFVDPFYVKALLSESFVWGILAYSVTSFFEVQVNHTTSHIDPMSLVPFGLVLSLFLTLAGIVFLKCFLGSSSRTPRIIAESAFLLGLSFPFIGVQLIADANRSFDVSQGWVARPTIERKYETKHRRRRGSYYRYHLELTHSSASSASLPFELPAKIQVDKDVYDRIAPNGRVELQIGAGMFGFPWLRSVRPGGW